MSNLLDTLSLTVGAIAIAALGRLVWLEMQFVWRTRKWRHSSRKGEWWGQR